jgi:hypothetical protein
MSPEKMSPKKLSVVRKLPVVIIATFGVLVLNGPASGSTPDVQASTGPATREQPATQGQTLEEFLDLDDADIVRARDTRRHTAVEGRTERCMEANGFQYTQVPMEAPVAEDTISPADLARTSGFGISASYLSAGTPPVDLRVPDDPNVPYIESLGPEGHSRYFETHAKCADTANEQVAAPVEAASATVEPFIEATYAKIKSDPDYIRAMDDWSGCIAASTGIVAAGHDEFKGQVYKTFAPKAKELAAAGDVAALRDLLQEEIRVATAASTCEGKRRQQVQPLVRQYESAMLSERRREFNEYRQALEMAG